jgi:hypothetical protein
MLLVVSANVGYLGSGDVLRSRMAHIDRLVDSKRPSFLALHFQEVGGDAKDAACIEELRAALIASPVLSQYAQSGLLCNADVTGAFTALGSAYFVRASEAAAVRVLDRQLDELVPLSAMQSQAGSSRHLTFAKTAQLANSRKGFMMVSFVVAGHRLEFVNTHFPADLSNVVAASAVPSEYAGVRADCLETSLTACAIGKDTKAVIAGDFNFRLNLKSLWDSKHAPGDKLEPKTMRLAHVDQAIKSNPTELLAWDGELACFNARKLFAELCELPISFPPTYCMRPDDSYDTKRCPAWCDRVLFTPALREAMVARAYESRAWECDHHLVLLAFDLSPAAPVSRMRHAPDEELAGMGRLNAASDGDVRRRRGPSVLYSLAPTLGTLLLIAAVGVYFYRRV